MSALAIATGRLPVNRTTLTELQASHEISRIVSASTDPMIGIDKLAHVALRVDGIHRVQIGKQDWGNTPADAVGSAVNGDVRIFFNPRTADLQSPVRFVVFVSQQVAHLLALLELQQQRARVTAELSSLRSTIEGRKLIQRARAILRNQENLDDNTALARLVEHSRASGKSLHDVARAFTVSEASSFRRPYQIRRPVRFIQRGLK